ncbi:hypothetical protein I79_018473 [Cricetulus griseus]|uniref:Uncharacterized protein n=1 Tax=Cricetulus griseus TaxID=10029 RepID=G3I4T5_CRIGR|nr:hypothetical protein I79_018473 [Cricetulus griseus]
MNMEGYGLMTNLCLSQVHKGPTVVVSFYVNLIKAGVILEEGAPPLISALRRQSQSNL